MTSLIVQDEAALGPVIWTGCQLQTLGTPAVPYDRAQNFYRYAGSPRLASAATTSKQGSRQ